MFEWAASVERKRLRGKQFSAMMPASHKTARYQPPRDFGAQTIEFRLTQGGASAHLEQMAIAERLGFKREGGAAGGNDLKVVKFLSEL